MRFGTAVSNPATSPGVGLFAVVVGADETTARAGRFVASHGVVGAAQVRVVGDGHLVAAGDFAVHDPPVDVRRTDLSVDPADVLLDGAHLLGVGFDAEGAEHRQGAVSDVGQAGHGEVPSM